MGDLFDLTYLLVKFLTSFRFFTRVTEQMKERLAWYKSTIEV